MTQKYTPSKLLVNTWKDCWHQYYYYFVTMGWDCVSVELWRLTDPFPIPHMIHEWIWSLDRTIILRENQRTRRETCSSVALSTTNPLGANPGLRGEKPATNCLCCGTAASNTISFLRKRDDYIIGLVHRFPSEYLQVLEIARGPTGLPSRSPAIKPLVFTFLQGQPETTLCVMYAVTTRRVSRWFCC
jgi:hypothetical protein